MKNYGINIEKELASQSPEDYRVGSTAAKPLFVIPVDERESYLPLGEVQKGKEDTMDCASRAPHNILEMEFLYGIKNKKFSLENTQWLFDKGYAFYINDALHFEVSDAFTAILSGTDESGNSLKAPLQSIHDNGLIPKKKLPLGRDTTLREYLDPSRITQEMRDLGKEFKERFSTNYIKCYSNEYGKTIIEGSIIVAGFAWPVPWEGEYPRVEMPINHAFILHKIPRFFAFDNYIDEVDGDFIKKLAHDYKFLDYGYRVFVSSDQPPRTRVGSISSVKRVINWLKKLWIF